MANSCRAWIVAAGALAAGAAIAAGPSRDTTSLPSGWPTPAILATDSVTTGRSPSGSGHDASGIIAESSHGEASDRPFSPSSRIESLAAVGGGILLSGFGIYYWSHLTPSNRLVDRKGANHFATAFVALVCVPVGVLMAGFGAIEFESSFAKPEH